MGEEENSAALGAPLNIKCLDGTEITRLEITLLANVDLGYLYAAFLFKLGIVLVRFVFILNRLKLVDFVSMDLIDSLEVYLNNSSYKMILLRFFVKV